jgi:hypothetical protein
MSTSCNIFAVVGLKMIADFMAWSSRNRDQVNSAFTESIADNPCLQSAVEILYRQREPDFDEADDILFTAFRCNYQNDIQSLFENHEHHVIVVALAMKCLDQRLDFLPRLNEICQRFFGVKNFIGYCNELMVKSEVTKWNHLKSSIDNWSLLDRVAGKSVFKIYREAREIISYGWVKGCLACDDNCHEIDPCSRLAVRFSIAGAVVRAAVGTGEDAELRKIANQRSVFKGRFRATSGSVAFLILLFHCLPSDPVKVNDSFAKRDDAIRFLQRVELQIPKMELLHYAIRTWYTV